MENESHSYLKTLSVNNREAMDDHLSSLRYAHIIQMALMPENNYMKSLFSDYFVLYMPRDIVSGDFYYVYSNRQFLYVAVGDCTGHGVPGALLTIMGISFLNEIFQCITDHKANRVLNSMREKVMKALRQKGDRSETMDSIDIGLCIYDRNNGKMQFSGANRPLLIVREGEIIEIKPDKMTLGVGPLNERPFSNHIIDTEKGDTFYLFSDGLTDQFGGIDDKKYKLNSLRNFLVKVKGTKLNSQKDLLKIEFDEWKGDTLQVDDVLVFGFKV